MSSDSNRGVVYLKPGSVEIQKIDFSSFRNPAGKTIDHGVILKVVTTNICGSDQHMVRGRTTAPAGMVLGHEITGEVIEKGRDVEYLEIGDRFPPAAAAGPAGPAGGRHRRVSACQLRTRRRRTDMSTWAVGSADKPTTSWCPTPISTC